MKKCTVANTLLVLSLCLIGFSDLQAQSLMKEVSLKDQINNSSLVVEGKVVSKKSVWDDNHSMVYTINTIEVYKIFKGKSASKIHMITPGGVIGLTAVKVFPSLSTKEGDIGVFTLKQSNISFNKQGKSYSRLYKPYASSQSLFKYDFENNKILNPYKISHGIKETLYRDINSITKKPYIGLTPFNVASKLLSKQVKLSGKNALSPPSNITFSPANISGGTGSVLTITGSGFGATKGKVGFTNADDGGVTFFDALDSQVLTWNDTRITVEVPSNVTLTESETAGTGKIRVTDTNGASATSANDLTVTFSEINVPSDATGTLIAYPIQHINSNGSGGYTFEMFTSFFNDTEAPGARAAFERSLNKWVCETGVNWNISNTATTRDVQAADDVNVIRFDNGDELENGVLGVCVSYYSGCRIDSNNLSWFVSEMDLIFNDTSNWHTGTSAPATNQIDFESVTLHELGHGHQLGHVIDPVFKGNNLNDVMHFASFTGETQRVLSNNNIIGANNVQARSTGAAVCREPVMTDMSCPLSIDEVAFNEGIRVFPNPSKGTFLIENESSIGLDKVDVYDINGRLVFNDSFSNSKRKTITMKNVSGGLYLMRIHSNNGASIIKKVMIK